MPVRNVNDPRFDFLKNTFLKYLASWKASIDQSEGKFTKVDKSKMFFSSQTYTSNLNSCNIKFIFLTKGRA